MSYGRFAVRLIGRRSTLWTSADQGVMRIAPANALRKFAVHYSIDDCLKPMNRACRPNISLSINQSRDRLLITIDESRKLEMGDMTMVAGGWLMQLSYRQR